MPLKSIRQNHTPTPEQLQLMDVFKDMVNHCIRIGLEHNCSTMKKLSMLSYQKLKDYPIQSYYKLTAISQAAGSIAYKGWSRFCHPGGLSVEAVKGNVVFVSNPLILQVDGSKLVTEG
jgi:hypothetical protein